MQVGLISPIPHLESLGGTEFHLILSHVLNEHSEYLDFYRQRSRNGDFIVLDNSAHELGAGGDIRSLLDQAFTVGASEVVLPDVLFSDRETVRRTTEAIRILADSPSLSSLMTSYGMSVMVVPQAKTVYDWGVCLRELLLATSQLPEGIHVTIGVSKDYETWPGGLGNLIDRYVRPRYEANFGGPSPLSVHLLGWGRELYQLSSIVHRFPWIRSTDSAKPFVYAMNGIQLNFSRACPKYPGRPYDYFTRTLTSSQQDLANRNIDVFRVRAGQLSREDLPWGHR
ncbi:MAG: hypothetical protein HC888_04115 [Candidatus Competibacteraceae bacterium]|nr:hypothetical protein [Candidatus Competibacteraceae bacterium]